MACNSSKKAADAKPQVAQLEGTWELNYISGSRIAFDGLYPRKKPTIYFDVASQRVSGNTSCNNFNGKLNAEGNRISFKDPMAMTKMMCMDGNGESVFLDTLQKIDKWSVTDGNTLNLIMGDIGMMRFVKIADKK
jgi:heat shock protein HslJ